MPTKSWGPYTWNLLHTLSENINTSSDNFEEKFKEFKRLIYTIVSNLPCPLCTKHSVLYFRKHNIDKVSPNEMKKFIFEFHNDVNKNLKKELFNYEDLEKTYKNNNIFQAFNIFYNRFNQSINGMFGFKQKKALVEFHIWFLQNKNLFGV